MNFIPDEIDLSQYLRAAVDIRARVKRISDYHDEMRESFAHHESGHHDARMSSTKLRDAIEFRPGEVTVWAGYNGHRKSTFAGQVALDLMQQNESVLIASFEMRASDTLKRMARQALATEKPNSYELKEFSDWTNGRGWVFDHLGEITPERCIAVCRYFAEELKGRHVFIDSMMMVVASEEHLDGQKQFITALVRLAIETGIHVHLIAHCRKPQGAGTETKPPTKYDIRGSSAISDQAHNVITIWCDKSGSEDSCDFIATVEKQRNGPWEGRVKLWFDSATMRFTDDNRFAVAPYDGLRV